MKKPHINLIIDALLLLVLAAMMGIGLLIQFVLVSGIRRREIYGSQVDLSFLNWGRHEWGYLHYILGLIFLVLIALHIVLHWDMIKSIAKRLIPNRALRWVIGVLLLVLTVVLTAFPALVKPRIGGLGDGEDVRRGRGGGRGFRGGRNQMFQNTGRTP